MESIYLGEKQRLRALRRNEAFWTGELDGGPLHPFEQREIFIAREPSGFEIVPDDENRDLPVSRDDNRAS